MDDKIGLWIVAIVGIVAIFGITIFALGHGLVEKAIGTSESVVDANGNTAGLARAMVNTPQTAKASYGCKTNDGGSSYDCCVDGDRYMVTGGRAQQLGNC